MPRRCSPSNVIAAFTPYVGSVAERRLTHRRLREDGEARYDELPAVRGAAGSHRGDAGPAQEIRPPSAAIRGAPRAVTSFLFWPNEQWFPASLPCIHGGPQERDRAAVPRRLDPAQPVRRRPG